MNREQMIAWLTLEGWEYWYCPPRKDDDTAADWLRKEGLDLVYEMSRDTVFRHQGTTEGARQEQLGSRLTNADLAVMVAYIQEHGL